MELQVRQGERVQKVMVAGTGTLEKMATQASRSVTVDQSFMVAAFQVPPQGPVGVGGEKGIRGPPGELVSIADTK